MLAMLVVATALTRITCVHSRPTNDDDFDGPSHMARSNAEEEPQDMLEQLRNHERPLEMDVKKIHEIRVEKYDITHHDDRSTTDSSETEATPVSVTISLVHLPTEETRKRPSVTNEEVDVVDRADHVTQYLAELLVNTDSEITSLQAVETEDDREGTEVIEDKFFAFLTGLEKPVEVEGAWSYPADEEKIEEIHHNAITDDEYKE